MVRHSALWASAVGASALLISSAQAGISASQVVDYSAGTVVNSYWGVPYTNSSAALGTPDQTQNVPNLFDSGGNQIAFADNSAITPFNASYNPQNIVAIQNAGGQITLKLSAPVTVGSGAALGIHAAVGLQDAAFPSGQNGNPATTYTDPRQADLQVSQNGSTWVDLGDKTFDAPTNIFTDASDPTGVTPGTTPANVFQPFDGNLSSFNGEDFAQVLATLNGSAGGNWFDLSTLGLTNVDYVRLSTSDGEKLFLDAVVATDGTSSGSGGSGSGSGTGGGTGTTAVPLPTGLAMGMSVAPLGLLALRRRRPAR
jgi:hypothetical protein